MSKADLPPGGWYDDPDTPSVLRYWDGAEWSDQRRAKQPSQPPIGLDASPAPPTSDPVAAFGAERLIAVLGAVAAIIGSLGPWVTADAGFFSITKHGTDDGSDGIVTLIAGAIALAFLLLRRPTGAAIISALATALAVYDLFDVTRLAGEAAQEDVRVTAGWGLWLTAVGFALCFFGSLALRRKAKKTDDQAQVAAAGRMPPPPTGPKMWAVDPFDRHGHRYFDGHRWTDRVADSGTESLDPPEFEVPAEPVDGTGDWLPDPSGRYSLRYYSTSGGWTADVARNGQPFSDEPTFPPPSDAS